MSYGGGFYGRTERGRHQGAPHYDQVPSGTTLPRDPPDCYPLQPLREQPAAHLLALSADPLPPPPLPHQPPVGPEFDPSGSEGGDDNATDPDPALDIKPVHRFIPDSWKNFFRGTSGRSASAKPPWGSPMPASSPSPSPSPTPASANNNNNGTSGGVRCSPPASPSVPGSSSYRDPYGGSGVGGSSYNSRKELLGQGVRGGGGEALESLSGRTQHTALTYAERVDEYHLRYDYMKSWSGLLRILGCVELLLGAAVFACVCAYVHKDNEWFNMFGYSSPGGSYGGAYGGGMYGAGTGGAYYTGPKTPFVLVVAGLAWIMTVIVLVMGMTMYYRTILLDSSWWPLTEFIINLALAVLYMAAGIMYVRDTTRGGLCSYPVFNNGINGVFCRTEAGQVAAIIFLFVTMVIYLIGAIVCLKLWRHEAARKYREKYGQRQMLASEFHASRITAAPVPIYKGPDLVQGSTVDFAPAAAAPLHHHKAPVPAKVLQGAIPSGHIPKPVVMPDYIAKYPTIRSDDERDQYRAVFNDQYAEYKEIHSDVQATLKKFEEMDSLMHSLPQHPHNQMEYDRINRILQEYQRKKSDPQFLEKKERCEYLKNKLSHIKQKIHEYDKVMTWNDGYD